jgi:hypothetical protein
MQCRPTHAQKPPAFLSAHPHRPPPAPDLLAQRLGWGLRVITQELDYARQVAHIGVQVASLPVSDGVLMDAQLDGQVGLRQPEVEPAGQNMVADGLQGSRIRIRLWFWRT